MSVVSKSTRSDDHPPDWHPIPAHTHNTVEKGTVLPGYGNPIHVPVPMRTCDRKHMVLPVPVSCLSSTLRDTIPGWKHQSMPCNASTIAPKCYNNITYLIYAPNEPSIIEEGCSHQP
jgi:hypothetical protein